MPFCDEGKECGDDGCGGNCGECPPGCDCKSVKGACEGCPVYAEEQLSQFPELVCGANEEETSEDDGDSVLPGYNCAPWEEEGPEEVFVLPKSLGENWVRLDLTSGDADLDLFVTSGASSDSCVAYGDETVTFYPEAGVDYYIIVDGAKGTAGPFTLNVTCSSQCEPQCTDAEGNTLECGSDGCGDVCGECKVGFCHNGFCHHYDQGCVEADAPVDNWPCYDDVCEQDEYCCVGGGTWDSICAFLCLETKDGCKFGNHCGGPDGNGCLSVQEEDCDTCPEDCGCDEEKKCYLHGCVPLECNSDNEDPCAAYEEVDPTDACHEWFCNENKECENRHIENTTCYELVDGRSCIACMQTDRTQTLKCSNQIIYGSQGFSQGLDDWTVSGGFWETGTPEAVRCSEYGYDDPWWDVDGGDEGIHAGVRVNGCVGHKEMVNGAFLISDAMLTEDDDVSELYLTYRRWLNTDWEDHIKNVVEVCVADCKDSDEWGAENWTRIWPTEEDAPGPPGIHDREWVTVLHDITNYAKPGLRIRFGFKVTDEDAYSVSSWNLDDIQIFGCPKK